MGLIFSPKDHEWAGTHAQVPTVLVMKDRFRIYYAARNKEGKSFPTFIDVDRSDPKKIIYTHKKQITPHGTPGMFDDDGNMPSYVIENEGKLWMYYSGWNQRKGIPYHNATGLSVSSDGGETFDRMFDGPVIDRNQYEPYIAVTPTILREKGTWHVWYGSGTRWEKVGEKYEPVYVVKYGTSKDGIHWERKNHSCIKQKHPLEAFAHPSVVKWDGIYHMWYCYRDSHDFRDGKGAYRMGYATSKDKINWDRKDDEAGIDISKTGWDSTMICYPYVVEVDGTLMMFHNGNGFGQSGIGYAVLEK